MTLSEPAERIWEMCEEYLAIACEHLVLQAPYHDQSNERTFDTKTERMRIQFLFPDLASETAGFKLLLEISDFRWRLQDIQRTDKQEQSVASARSTEDFEAFCDQKRERLQDFYSRRSPIQQEILRAKFFPNVFI